MKTKDSTNISAEMDSLYKRYFQKGAKALSILPFIDDFLLKYPNYPEALVFKARMLISIGRDGEAKHCLKTAQKIDRWRLVGIFDEAEINLKKNKPEKALETYIKAIKAYTSELSDGIEAFLLTCNEGSGVNIEKRTNEAIIKFFSGKKDSAVFDDLLMKLKKKANKIKHY